jgi:Protein of unknown function DUF262
VNDRASARPEHEAGYGYRVVTVSEAVDCVTSGQWDIPEFQRQFVWQPSQVGELADSLWRNYPIGAPLLWRRTGSNGDSHRAQWWIADGQQRLTSLCLLHGREPVWLRRKSHESRMHLMRRFDLCFDPGADRSPRFVPAHPVGDALDPRLVPLRKLMNIDPRAESGREQLEGIVTKLQALGCCRQMDAAELCRRLGRVSMLGQRQLVITEIRHEREDVLEIFERLNSRGMRFRKLLLKLAMEEIPAAIRGARGL